jgi:hypothetical protein
MGLAIGLVLGKILFKSLDKPLFIEALISIIFCNPTVVACSLEFNSLIIYVNRKKISSFNKGYLLKWGIITEVRSAKD